CRHSSIRHRCRRRTDRRRDVLQRKWRRAEEVQHAGRHGHQTAAARRAVDRDHHAGEHQARAAPRREAGHPGSPSGRVRQAGRLAPDHRAARPDARPGRLHGRRRERRGGAEGRRIFGRAGGRHADRSTSCPLCLPPAGRGWCRSGGDRYDPRSPGPWPWLRRRGRATGQKDMSRSATEHLYAVILAGGSGTRFWPLSRHLYPKQLLKILGTETLIQQTMRRVLRSVEPEHVFISTNPAQADSIRFQLAEWKDALHEHYILEPESRNTAPAIALAAAWLVQRDPNAVMLMLPA